MTTSITLSISDLTTQNPDEPRILDTRIAKSLGMSRPTNIRQLIEANRDELETHGLVHAVRAPTRSGKGRVSETTEYHLNEAQTLLVCMFSRTDRAAQVRKQVIEVFMAYRRGQLSGQDGQLAPLADYFADGEYVVTLKDRRVVTVVEAETLDPPPTRRDLRQMHIDLVRAANAILSFSERVDVENRRLVTDAETMDSLRRLILQSKS